MKAAGELLESAEVHGHGYGTPRAPVERVLAEGRDMLFDIDWQGAKQVRERLGEDVVSIFVLPPSMRELRARLERRAEDTASSIAARFENARREIERWRDYHYVVVNDDLTRAYRDVKTIVAAERLRAKRIQPGVERLVERLVAERGALRIELADAALDRLGAGWACPADERQAKVCCPRLANMQLLGSWGWKGSKG